MKRYIRSSSSGDVQLAKFVFIPSEYIDGIETKNYDSFLNGYLYLWNYIYNKLTHYTDDRLMSHSDVVDALPPELKRKDRIWGRVDYYPAHDRKSLFIGGDVEPTEDQRKYLTKLCNI